MIVLSVKSFEKNERVRVDFIKYIYKQIKLRCVTTNVRKYIPTYIYGHMYVDSPLVRYTSAARAKRFGNASSNFVSACTYLPDLSMETYKENLQLANLFHSQPN